MRVGILTFVGTLNYGAILQAYALQETVIGFGHKCELIQYINKDIASKENNTIKSLKPKTFMRVLLKNIFIRDGFKKKKQAFKTFEDINIHYSKPVDEFSIKQLNLDYDLFIAGSDQIWNLSLIKNDWTYFLNFADEDKYKIAYAPSFGNNAFPMEYSETVSSLIKNINKLSVRENSGKLLVEKIFERNVDVVCDPTFLLTESQWFKRVKYKPILEHYILVYFPHDKKNVFSFVNKLKKKTGLPVVYISISPKVQFGTKTIYDASPEEFLGWIFYADYIVTGSFHGTAFSLIFKKQFYHEYTGEGSRIDSLIKMCGIKNRCINEDFANENEIDYDKVSIKIDMFRNDSLKWLMSAFQEWY